MERMGNSSRAVSQNEVQRLRRPFIMFIVTVFIILGTCAVSGNLLSSAHDNRREEPVNFGYYKSIVIQPGDTLWDIAGTYITKDYSSIPDYVQALKDINSLNSDQIQSGQNLMVIYSSTEFVNK